MKVASFILLLIGSIAFLSCHAEHRDPAHNLDFEKIQADHLTPEDWIAWGTGYTLSADPSVKRHGNHSLRIEPDGKAASRSFGGAGYAIPADYKGTTIELRGYLRLQDVRDGFAGLLLRIDGEGGPLEFDNMQARELQGTSGWKKHSIELPFPDEAETIMVGALLTGSGKLWVDDLSVFIDGKPLTEATPKPRKAYKAEQDREFDKGSGIVLENPSARTLEHLVLLGKIWGFLKYHHPAVARGDYQWDYELFRILPKILNGGTNEDRNAELSRWISGLGSVDTVENTSEVESERAKLKPDVVWIEDVSKLGGTLSDQLVRIKNAKRTNEHYYIGMERAGNPAFKHELQYASFPYPDAGYRLLALYRYWNIIQYYFPYKHLIEEDWNAVLPEFLPRFIAAENELEYTLAALELVGRVHDSHAGIWKKNDVLDAYQGSLYAPLLVRFVENRTVVTGFSDDALGAASGLKIGDVLLDVDGESVEAIVRRKLPFTPGSNLPAQLRDISGDLLRTNARTLTIRYERSGIERIRTIACFPPTKAGITRERDKEKTSWRRLGPDIGCLYPGSLQGGELLQMISGSRDMKGIVIDLRCYPSEFIVFNLGEYLMPKPSEFVKFTKGSVQTPGLFTFSRPLKVGKKNPGHYMGRIVIIVDETTQSSAEYTAMAFRAAPRAVVIGSATAGADGNVSDFTLPGGIATRISGIGVYYPDGRETQRVGIVPDIEIHPTLQGIRSRRDELLEKAVEIIQTEKYMEKASGTAR